MSVPRPRATGIAAMAVAIGLSAWLLATHDEGVAIPAATQAAPATSTATTETVAAGILTEAQLRTQAGQAGRPLYWVGPRADRRYGIRRDPQSGAVAVAYYLAQGDQEVSVVTIPLADAFGKTEQLAAQPGAVSHRLVDGGIAWSPGDRPLTAYVAQPNLGYVIEIDAQRPGVARRLAFTGQAHPVG